jgi:putative nucleotidyltransferase with HDIG domain
MLKHQPLAPSNDPMERAARWIQDTSALASPPDVCIKLFELMESETASAQALGDVISRDPSLTAKLLRIVNSSFYGFSRRIDTVSRAITVIGMSELYNLAIAVSAVTSFSRIPNSMINIDTFWRHGVYCGVMSRELALRCKVLHPERLFVAGLLHDIGSLIIYNRAPETIKSLLLASQGDETDLRTLEIKAFGFSHAAIGAMLLDRWLLPPDLVQSVRHHHDPSATNRARLEAAIIHISDSVANHYEQGAFYCAPSARLTVDEGALEVTGLDADEETFTRLAEGIREQYRAAIDLFGV